jgi:prepilin-type N-terminal cleavage/methylation domain-containing protein
MKKRMCGREGFSLVEIMVAAVILSIILAGSAMFLISASRQRLLHRQKSAAMVLSNALLEEAYAVTSEATFSAGNTVFLLEDGDFSNANPGRSWEYDGETYPIVVRLEKNGDFADISSRVAYREYTTMSNSVPVQTNLAVVLMARKYLE